MLMISQRELFLLECNARLGKLLVSGKQIFGIRLLLKHSFFDDVEYDWCIGILQRKNPYFLSLQFSQNFYKGSPTGVSTKGSNYSGKLVFVLLMGNFNTNISENLILRLLIEGV